MAIRNFVGFAAVAAAMALALAAPAQAAVTLNYSLTGDYAAKWRLDSQQLPDPADVVLGEGVTFRNVIGDFPGTLASDLIEVCFFNEALGGGILIGDDTTGAILASMGDAVGVGKQLYSGSEAAPTLLTGEFDFIGVDDDTGDLIPALHYHLSVAPVPEPATWLMLIFGFGGIGAAIRRKRARNSIFIGALRRRDERSA